MAGAIHLFSSQQHDASPMKSVVMQGSDDYVALAGYGALNHTVGTWCGWVNIVDLTATYCVISIGDTDAISYIALELVAGKIRARCYNATALKFSLIATTTTITQAGWHHLAIVQNGVKPVLYVDGTAVTLTDTDTTDTTLWMSAVAGFDNFSIGILSMNTSTTEDFNGGIAFVKLGSSAWSAEEVMLEYKYRGGQQGTGSSQTRGIVASYDFDENYLDDTTGAGTYAGTATGGAYLDANYSDFVKNLIAVYTGATDIYSLESTPSALYCLHVANT